jgi:hypothetical protein
MCRHHALRPKNASWPHSVGSTASGQYYADERPSPFRPRWIGAGSRSGSLVIVMDVCCWESVIAGRASAVFSGAVSAAARVTLPTITCPRRRSPTRAG